MREPAELQQISPSLWLWQAFDPSVKADLFSTVALAGSALFLVDPIPLIPGLLEGLLGRHALAGLMVTNAHHARATAQFAGVQEVPIYCPPEAAPEFKGLEIVELSNGMEIVPGLTAIALPGGAPGEFAFHFADDGGTIVVGDALIHLHPYGFSLLPAKYCQNQKELRQSLQRLLDFSFSRLLFAHGMPLLRQARERLEVLLR